MKGLIIGILTVTCLALVGLGGCFHIVGSGPIQEKVYNLSGFDGVNISNSFSYEILQSPDFEVTVSTRESLIKYLDVYTSMNILYVKYKMGTYSNTDAKVIIGMPEVKSINISGACKGSVTGFESNEKLTMNVSGASRMDMQIISGDTNISVSGASKLTGYLKAEDLYLNVSGASRSEVEGSAGDANLEVSGASQVYHQDMTLQNADVQVSGASRMVINTDGELNLNVSGASTLKYVGNPTLKKINISGASTLEKQD